jgi:CHAD domain-containing protein
MGALARPVLLVNRPAEEFLRQWPLSLTGDVEGIHQARVATRRLREALPLLARSDRDREPAWIRSALRSLTRALGPSRELDVSRIVLAEIARRTPTHAAAAAAADRRLAVERAAAATVLVQIGQGIDVAALIGRTRELAIRLQGEPGTSGCARRAGARLRNRASQLHAAVLAAGRVYAPGPLHGVRISLKTFRYAFELAGRLSRGRHGATLRRLKTLQDILGDMHDLQVLAAQVRDAGAWVAVRDQPALEALAGHLDDQIRDLHSRYVTKRVLLTAVLARARRLARDLAARRPPDEPVIMRPPATGAARGRRR